MYSYAGDFFRGPMTGGYTNQDHVTGSFVVASAFTENPAGGGTTSDRSDLILSYRFTDGMQTLTEANSTARIGMYVALPDSPLAAPGTPMQWVVLLQTATDAISSYGIKGGVYGEGSDQGCLGCIGIGPVTGNGSVGIGSGGLYPRPEFGGNGGGAIGTWTVQTVAVPELAILPRAWLRGLKFGPGLGIDAAITSRFQNATAKVAAIMLGIIRVPARRDGIFIDLPRVRVEVAEACSGVQTLVLMLAAAALIATVLPTRRLPWALALFVLAIILALEANALRVAGIAIGLEHLGAMSRGAKDWIQIGTTGIALAQLVGIGRLAGR